MHGIAAYERAFKSLEGALDETGGPWILGTTPTLADINLMPYAARLDFLGLLDLWIKDRPNVKSWWTTVRQWPSFKTGLYDRISENEIAEMGLHGPKIVKEVAEALVEIQRNALAATSQGLT